MDTVKLEEIIKVASISANRRLELIRNLEKALVANNKENVIIVAKQICNMEKEVCGNGESESKSQ